MFNLMMVFLFLRYKKHEEEVHQELTELQEHEHEIMLEWEGSLTALHDQLGNSLTSEDKLLLTKQEKAELQQKLDESSSSQEQVGPLLQPALI
jgi:hypothetical protein